MNPPEMLFLCNEAAAGHTGSSAGVTKLRTAGSGKNVRLELDEVGRQLNRNIAPALIDLVEIASLVYIADQVQHRGADEVENMGATWRRRMRFEIPVRVPSLWRTAEISDSLVELLSFLSEDEYDFTFTQYKHPPALDAYLSFGKLAAETPPETVVLFSGGLDSLGGVLEEVVRDKRSALLITHEPTTKLRGRHRTLRSMVANATDGPVPQFITVRVNKKDQKEREYTQRARSFLYASLAVAAARMADLNAIRFFENGVVSLNLPVSPQVVGSRATRTTHPRVLACMRRLFSSITGGEFTVNNGFLWKTKSDIVADIVKGGQGSMIEWSTSCTHTWTYRKDKPHCGICSQCIDRRFAVLANNAGQFEPAEKYRHHLLTEARDEGESRIMLASYLETAQQVADMDITAFCNRFGEAARAFPYLGMPPDDAANSIFDLYKRHARQVMSVIEAEGKAHMSEIRKRSLPPTCALRLVHDPNPNTTNIVAPSVSGSVAPAPPSHQLAQEGQAWLLRFEGIDKRFELSVGMVYLHAMLSMPNKSFTVAELYSIARPHMKNIPSARSEAAFDEKAARAYWQRLTELDAEIAAAEKGQDTTAMRVAENEKARLLTELKAARFAGRPKIESADHKRLRDRVRNAVDRTIKIIKKYHSSAGAHLDEAISRGSVMTYAPAEIPPWIF
ncbi:MAG: hypothetical protein HBSAPP02_27700 [Phycisphaerae bacterium]|nr:MAG: hypothetical protein HRU71_01250 [Planctomycetia bacterium]GJQ27738.1 MAG: hypothetical protein HBSAPP02_27700 [Phycisphaerae bacterium]